VEVVDIGGLQAAVFPEIGPRLSHEQHALDLLGETYGHDVSLMIVPAARFAPEFFDLSTRLAGGFLQKMSNYGMRLAIVGDISAHLARSTALAAFVAESTAGRHVMFVADRGELAKLL
jgi:hypothetical protein